MTTVSFGDALRNSEAQRERLRGKFAIKVAGRPTLSYRGGYWKCDGGDVRRYAFSHGEAFYLWVDTVISKHSRYMKRKDEMRHEFKRQNSWWRRLFRRHA